MPAFGIMTLHGDTEQQFLFDMAKYAAGQKFDVYWFSPDSVDVENARITGFRFCPEKNGWEKDRFPFPDVIYDRCFYRNEEEIEQYAGKIKGLKTHPTCTFLSYGLPNKWTVYEVLKHNEQIKPYLPETKLVTDGKQLLKMIKEKGEILIKPIFGSQGRGIYVLRQKGDGVVIKTVKNKEILEKNVPEEKLLPWLNSLMKKYSYISQPFLPLVDRNNHPFDLRLFLQKNEGGKWVLLGKGMRFGKENSIISNLAGGGEPVSYETWRRQLAVEKREYVENEIIDLLSAIPPLLETIFQPLFELGMDIGIDKNGAVWLLEVNSKPGRNVFLQLYPDLYDTFYKAPVSYASYLLNTANDKRSVENEILSDRNLSG